MAENADENLINLAQILNDEDKIIVPFKADTNNKVSEQINKLYQNDAAKTSGLININNATKEELMTLTGIGESTASKIIDYRNSVSKFVEIEDLKNVSGIGEAKFNSIKNKITTK